MISTGNAVSTFTAQNMGAGKPERVRKGYRAACAIAGGFALLICLILLFFYLIVLIEGQRGSLPRRLGVCLLWGLALGVLLRAVNIVRPISAILVIALVLWLLFLRGHDIKDGAQWKMWLVILVALLGIYKATGELWDRHVENVLGMEPASFPVYNIYVGFNEETQGQWSAEDMDLLFSYLSRPGATTSEASPRPIVPGIRSHRWLVTTKAIWPWVSTPALGLPVVPDV